MEKQAAEIDDCALYVFHFHGHLKITNRSLSLPIAGSDKSAFFCILCLARRAKSCGELEVITRNRGGGESSNRQKGNPTEQR